MPFPGKPLMTTFFVVGNDGIYSWAAAEDITYPGKDKDRNFAVRKVLAYRPYRRSGHNRITNPVGRTNKNFTGIFGERTFQGLSLF
jgi:hypothetical protein